MLIRSRLNAALAWLGHSSSDILDLYYHLHDDDTQQAMQALAMTNGGAGAAGQQPLNTGDIRKTGCAQTARSWVSFGTQAPLGVEAASQTTGKTAAAALESPIAENPGLSACGPIRAQDSKRQAAQASAGDKILKAERGGFEPPIQT